MNGLRYEIQDEMSMVTIRNVEDAYQIALKDEEKLARKQGQREEVEFKAEAKKFPRAEYRSPRMKKINLITT